jgi:hypothetical protein
MECVVATGVGRDHAAERARRATGGIRREAATNLREFRVELVKHHPRLNSNGIRTDRKDLPEVNAQVDRDCWTERFAGKSSACTARNDSDVVAVAVANKRRDTLDIGWHCNGEWFNLKRAGVGRVQPSCEPVEVQPPAELSAEVIGDLLLVEHSQ